MPTMKETQVQYLGQEDLLEKEMAIHSSLRGKSHGQKSIASYSPRGRKESDTTEQLHFHFSIVWYLPAWLKSHMTSS